MREPLQLVHTLQPAIPQRLRPRLHAQQPPCEALSAALVRGPARPGDNRRGRHMRTSHAVRLSHIHAHRAHLADGVLSACCFVQPLIQIDDGAVG